MNDLELFLERCENCGRLAEIGEIWVDVNNTTRCADEDCTVVDQECGA